MIRKASTDDIRAIREMASVVFPDTYRQILSPAQLEYMMDMMYSEESLRRQMTSGGHTFFICEGRGYVSFRHEGVDESGTDVFHLEKLYVMPAHRHGGLGKKLFDTVADAAREASSCSRIRLELNVNRHNPAVGFYEHIGMRKARRGDFPIGNGYYMNDFIMACEL